MDTYSKTIIQKFDNGVNIVHIPDLTDEERARRQAQLRRAAEQLLKEAERVKKQHEGQNVPSVWCTTAPQ